MRPFCRRYELSTAETRNQLVIEKIFLKKYPKLGGSIEDLQKLLLKICFSFFYGMNQLLGMFSLKNRNVYINSIQLELGLNMKR